MSDVIAFDGAPPNRIRNVVFATVVLLAAVAVFAAALYYSGGVDFVANLFGRGVVTAAASTKPSRSATPAAASETDATFARRLYVEQIESAANMERMAAGRIASLTVKRVSAGEAKATVAITAAFTDGTTADGAISMESSGGTWYLLSLTGLRGAGAGSATSPEASQTLEAKMSKAGVKTFDEGVLAALVAQSAANQTLVQGILKGTYTTLVLGEPLTGAGTISIPVKITGEGTAEKSAQIVLVRKDVDGATRTFLTSLKAQ